MKAWLAWIGGAIAFVLVFHASIFGLYGWWMQSDRMAGLSERSRAYDR